MLDLIGVMKRTALSALILICLGCLGTNSFPFIGSDGLTVAISPDEAWKINVLRNQSVTATQHYFDRPGEHAIAIYALDEGLILDQMAVDFQPERKFYELPAAH